MKSKTCLRVFFLTICVYGFQAAIAIISQGKEMRRELPTLMLDKGKQLQLFLFLFFVCAISSGVHQLGKLLVSKWMLSAAVFPIVILEFQKNCLEKSSKLNIHVQFFSYSYLLIIYLLVLICCCFNSTVYR